MIIRSFKKCGNKTKVDGSENSQVNIGRLNDYVMPAPEEEFHLKTYSSKEGEDEEWVTDNDNNDNNNCATDFEESNISDDENKD